MQLEKPIAETYWVVPGLFLAGEYPASTYSPQRARQRIASFLKHGFGLFLDLTSPGDAPPYQELLVQESAEFGLQTQYQRFPVPDYGLPAPQQMQAILNRIDLALAQQQKTYLHCQGGIGRTGTVVGCYLVQHGLDAQQALSQLAAWWQQVPKSQFHPRSPETSQQEDFIRNWAETRRIIEP